MIGRTGLVFVSCSLTYLVSEEICGRFGSFDGRSTARHINALRLRSMIECQLHCLSDFMFLWKLKHDEQKSWGISLLQA